MTITMYMDDCREMLPQLPDESVHCVVTSPPYWGLRDYGIVGQIGLEPDFHSYVANMVEVFCEVRRVLRNDGTLWLNLGDSYAANTKGSGGIGKGTLNCGPGLNAWSTEKQKLNGTRTFSLGDLKPKDLCGIPWRVAFALQSDGWYLRQDIVWSKPNPMPESVTDRCTKAHEYLFLLSKSERYYYDAEAIAEPTNGRELFGNSRSKGFCEQRQDNERRDMSENWFRNKRSVWEVTTQPFSEAHFATFPPALIEPCIKAGTSEKGCCSKCGAPWRRMIDIESRPNAPSCNGKYDGNGKHRTFPGGVTNDARERIDRGWLSSCKCSAPIVPCTVLDPFAGAGTTGLVADRLQRNAILIELNPNYADMSERRIVGDAPLFVEVLHARRPDGRSSER